MILATRQPRLGGAGGDTETRRNQLKKTLRLRGSVAEDLLLG